MPASISRTGLDSFMAKVSALSVKGSQEVLRTVAESGRAYAQAQYASDGDIAVGVEAKGNHASIIAQGEQVLYKEFGTGKVGEGTYQGNLPTQTFVFESPTGSGEIQRTQGWEYFYPNARTKRGDAWYHKGQRYIGERAGGQMWKTREYVRVLLKQSMTEKIKGTNNDRVSE